MIFPGTELRKKLFKNFKNKGPQTDLWPAYIGPLFFFIFWKIILSSDGNETESLVFKIWLGASIFHFVGPSVVGLSVSNRKFVIFDITNVEAKMRFYRSLKWIRSTDAPTLFLDEVVCPPPLPWCYKIMWTAVRYLGAARKIWNDGFYWKMFSPMVLEMELSCPSNAVPC